jgi:hypothetical protein
VIEGSGVDLYALSLLSFVQQKARIRGPSTGSVPSTTELSLFDTPITPLYAPADVSFPRDTALVSDGHLVLDVIFGQSGSEHHELHRSRLPENWYFLG